VAQRQQPDERLVLVLNAGSSSLRYQVVALPGGQRPHQGHVERIEGGRFGPALEQVVDELDEHDLTGRLAAVGHRVVHGGSRHVAPEPVDDDLIASVDDLARLAPLHNPPAAEGMRRAREAFPGLPQLAVFDTAFFADLPEVARTYAIDRELAEREDVRRYGMHGTSHSYVSRAVADHLDRRFDEVDQVVLHLGNGASAAAIRGGRPVDTSMGLTPLEGLVMGTRGGDVDPGVLLHLQRHAGLDVDDLDDLLHHRSGLLGLAGHSDFRDLLEAVDGDDPGARLAYDVYCRRLTRYVGAYLAVLGGADALSFTGGVGEHVPRVREDSLAGLERLGVEIDPDRNRASAEGARVISTDRSRVAVLVVPTDEELAIARLVLETLDT
jgi:acetate kinase